MLLKLALPTSAVLAAATCFGLLAALPAHAQTPVGQSANPSVSVPVTSRANAQVIPDGSATTVFNFTGALQTFTVPPGVTSIRIVARGAQGGDVTNNAGEQGGLGATMQGDFTVVPGSVLNVVVGGRGSIEQYTSGGGGGSGVSLGATPLIVAGGGGGVDYQDVNYPARHAVTGANGQPGNNGGGAGGTAGGDGGDYIYAGNNISRGGRGFLSNTAGSTGQNGTSPNTVVTNGVFGLGGGGGSVGSGWCNCGAGGGGYSGGGSGDINTSGGGGGSFNAGTNQVNTAGDNSGNGIVSITVLTPTTDLQITKTDGSSSEVPGTSVTYTVVASNAGPSAATGAVVSDTLPAILSGATWTCVAAGGGTCTAAGSGNIADTINLPVGASATYTINATIAASATGNLVNTASIAPPAGLSDTNPANDSATDTNTLVPSADLAITLTDTPDPVIAGTGQITYVATITNGGPSDAQVVALSLPMAANTTFVSAVASAGGSCTTPAVGANGTVNCSWAGATAPGAGNARSVTIIVGVSASATGVLSVTGTASTSTTDPTAANNTATTTTTVNPNADLAITLTDTPDPVTAGAGGQITYTATILNNGPAPAQDVAISLPTAAGTTFISAAPGAGGVCGTQPAVGASGALSCTWAGTTAAAATRVLTVVVGVPASATNGTIFNVTGTASSPTLDQTPANNTATTTTTVNASADLAITLTDTPDPVIAGNNITYAVTVTNNGPSDAQGAGFSLPLPAATTFVSLTATGGTCTNPAVGSGGTVSCTWAGATTPTQVRSASVVARVLPSTAAGNISATATTATTTTDPTAANNTATATTAVQVSADLSMTLTVVPTQGPTGTLVNVTATVTNNGPSDAQNVQAAVTLPQPVNIVSSSGGAGGTCATTGSGTNNIVTCTWSGATAPTATRVATIQAVIALNASGVITAVASSPTTDPATPNNTTTASISGVPVVQAIPTTDRIGLILLSGLLLGLGIVAVRRQ